MNQHLLDYYSNINGRFEKYDDEINEIKRKLINLNERVTELEKKPPTPVKQPTPPRKPLQER